MDYTRTRVLFARRIVMAADLNPAPPIPNRVKETLRRLGLPAPERGSKVSAALVAQASEFLDDAARQRVWDELHAAELIEKRI
jgi:hypothetical protein